MMWSRHLACELTNRSQKLTKTGPRNLRKLVPETYENRSQKLIGSVLDDLILEIRVSDLITGVLQSNVHSGEVTRYNAC